MKPFRVLTIAGSDSGGGAGIQADLKTITVLGGFGMSVVTALTAQNTLGVQGIHDVPPDFVAAQFDAVATDMGIDAAKTGMLPTAEVIRVVAGKIRQYGVTKLVVDPVMAATGGMPLIRGAALSTLVAELVPLAFIITPNLDEAEALSGVRIATRSDMQEAALRIRDMGARHVVVKGGHLPGDAVDLLYDGEEFREFVSPRIDTKDSHGTGCTYSAAMAAGLAFGQDAAGAVATAKRYITAALRHAWRLGAGHGPTNHLAPLLMPEEGRSMERPGVWKEA
ncbi:MAG: bifunctional hydroxymethylpyrimidine kinase/phosphomethylpyrimidine kinase [Thermodesulfobacteriota bacterium]